MLQKIRVNWVTTYLHLCSFFAGLPSVSTPDDYYSSDDYYSYSSDDDYLSSEEKVVHTNPEFLSDSTNDWVNEGETIKLPCLVDKLGKVKSSIFSQSFLYRLRKQEHFFRASVSASLSMTDATNSSSGLLAQIHSMLLFRQKTLLSFHHPIPKKEKYNPFFPQS